MKPRPAMHNSQQQQPTGQERRTEAESSWVQLKQSNERGGEGRAKGGTYMVVVHKFTPQISADLFNYKVSSMEPRRPLDLQERAEACPSCHAQTLVALNWQICMDMRWWRVHGCGVGVAPKNIMN